MSAKDNNGLRLGAFLVTRAMLTIGGVLGAGDIQNAASMGQKPRGNTNSVLYKILLRSHAQPEL